MAVTLAIVLALAASPQAPLAPAGAVSSSEPSLAPRPLRERIHTSLRRWARPGDEEVETAARELLVLYDDLDQDRKLSDSQREKYRIQLRHRLLDLAERIAYLEAIKKRIEEPDRPASVRIPEGKMQPLAQRQGAGRAGVAPVAGVVGQGGTGGMPPDAGEELVDLIQSTVAPGSWDIRGGPGSIYYWRPGRALSVRQTGEVHEQVGGLLGQLRRAGQ